MHVTIYKLVGFQYLNLTLHFFFFKQKQDPLLQSSGYSTMIEDESRDQLSSEYKNILSKLQLIFMLFSTRYNLHATK